MGESGAAAFQFGPAEARARGVAPEELREALGLVQESVIKLLRFQLAMERRDRRVAMAVMDDVVLLERRLNSIVTRLPESPDAAPPTAAQQPAPRASAQAVDRAALPSAVVSNMPAAVPPDAVAILAAGISLASLSGGYLG